MATDNLTTAQWLALPASDPRSPLYLPPTGTYQNDAGNIVSRSTINAPVAPSAPSIPNATYDSTQFLPDWLKPFADSLLRNRANDAFGAAGLGSPTPASTSSSLEDITTIVVGLILIGAGLFAFKVTQTVIQTGGRAARSGAEFLAS